MPAPALDRELDELFARSWLRLLGAVSMEVYGHHQYMSVDADRLFEREMTDCGAMIAAELSATAGAVAATAARGGD